MKTAFIFPGQGAQKVGMGKEFYDEFSVSKAFFDEASEAVGLDLKALCFQENDKINITEYTQVCLLTTSVAILKVLEEQGVKPDVSAGLSLGEYCSLVATGAMKDTDAAKAVRQRGIFMEKEVPAGVGGMAAIIGMEADKIQAAIQDIDEVQIANYNCPGQIVISGKKEAVLAGSKACQEAGARRAIQLNVSGPFHSSLLVGAGEKLEKVLDEFSLQDPVVPYLANCTADYVTQADSIKPLLVRQVSNSVMWQQSIERMVQDGVEVFVEIGPGTSLAGFNKKIGRVLGKELTTYSVATPGDLEQVVAALA